MTTDKIIELRRLLAMQRGPWRDDAHVRETNDGLVTLIQSMPELLALAEQANTPLVSAAPDLAKALEDGIEHAQCSCSTTERLSGHWIGCWLPEWMETAKGALRKAGRLP